MEINIDTRKLQTLGYNIENMPFNKVVELLKSIESDGISYEDKVKYFCKRDSKNLLDIMLKMFGDEVKKRVSEIPVSKLTKKVKVDANGVESCSFKELGYSFLGIDSEGKIRKYLTEKQASDPECYKIVFDRKGRSEYSLRQEVWAVPAEWSRLYLMEVLEEIILIKLPILKTFNFSTITNSEEDGIIVCVDTELRGLSMFIPLEVMLEDPCKAMEAAVVTDERHFVNLSERFREENPDYKIKNTVTYKELVREIRRENV